MSDIGLDPSNFSADSYRKIADAWQLSGAHVAIHLPAAPVRYLYSGWQSWSLTAWVEAGRVISPTRPSRLHPEQTDPAYARETRPNGAWYAAVELAGGKVLLLGALGLDSHVRLDDPMSLTGWYEAGSGDWFLAAGDEDTVFNQYAQLLKQQLGSGNVQKPLRVWCSWYSMYREVYEGQLLKILADLGDLPFEVFQIDDGWQKGIGDWEPNAKFPSGMSELAKRIRATGRKAGLWLAPLLVVPSSRIYQNQRDWLLHDEKGRLVSAGFNWGEPLFALDTTHPAVLDWLDALMKKVRNWGYEYIKLDFLYAGGLPGKRHLYMPRECAYRTGLKRIREALGEAYLLTCGAPVLPSLGLCDGLRIGPDVASSWATSRDDDLLRNHAIPGGRNALRTTINRLWLQPLVHTDPDVVYFRSQANSLTPEQKSLLQDLALIADFKGTSDIPAWLTGPERAALRTFLESSPTVRKTGRAKYELDGRQVDFNVHIGLPASKGAFTDLIGMITGGLGNLPVTMKLIDALDKRALRGMLEENPV